jgi:hypothetical protein
MSANQIPVEGDGFLTEQAADRLTTLPGVNQRLMSVAVAVARYANRLVHALPATVPHPTAEQKQRVIALSLFVRLVECFESILILASHGVREELRSLFRVFLDAYFVLANVCSDANFVGAYLRADEAERLKLLNSMSKQDDELFAAAKEYATPEVRAELAAKVKAERIQAFNSYSNAEKVGCAAIYDSMYRITGPSVHTGPRILEGYLETDAEGTATKIIHHGNPAVIDRFVYDSTQFCLKSIRGMLECFGESAIDEVIELEAKLELAMIDPDNPAGGR